MGEGTGESSDLDRFDQHYRHLVLWDEEALEIVGAYRIGEVARYMKEEKPNKIYSAELFQYSLWYGGLILSRELS